MRVQIPVYSDHWMKGNRYGEVIGQWIVSANGGTVERYRVLLDKTGKKISVNADDCQVIETN